MYICICFYFWFYLCISAYEFISDSIYAYLHMFSYLILFMYIKLARTHIQNLQTHVTNSCHAQHNYPVLQDTATHCNTLQHTATQLRHTATHCNTTATHCNTLQHTATHCNTRTHLTNSSHEFMQCRSLWFASSHVAFVQDASIAEQYNLLQCVAACGKRLQCAAVCCSVLVCCIVLQRVVMRCKPTESCQYTWALMWRFCKMLQDAATHCNTLQPTATHSNAS